MYLSPRAYNKCILLIFLYFKIKNWKLSIKPYLLQFNITNYKAAMGLKGYRAWHVGVGLGMGLGWSKPNPTPSVVSSC